LVTRGDIWLVNLDPTVGSEIQKSRPCVIISPAEMHDHLRTAIVAPMSTGSRPAPFRIAVTHERKQGLILLDQIRAIDKSRLIHRADALDQKTMAIVLQTLQEVFSP
jgi:mRNA interferase MazF